ncbi:MULTISPECIES: hypothetical protein [Prevotellaceae]|uniref:hypothetical protein n=1 Tax=Prevotellaceae TaxID=171552 RepID=UPI00115FD7B7|nr:MULTISPECIES: hypothetical protein [Prevotellaceae]QVJ80086.1 hypothetical protein J4031_10335 [Xylanibacter ruminicola]
MIANRHRAAARHVDGYIDRPRPRCLGGEGHHEGEQGYTEVLTAALDDAPAGPEKEKDAHGCEGNKNNLQRSN